MSEEFSRALASALRFLKTRDRFESEIRMKLSSDGFAGSADGVIEHLKTKRIVDDKRLIEQFLDHAQRGKPVGLEKIKAKLLARGAPEDLIDALNPTNEQELAEAALRKKPAAMKNAGTAGRFLIGRGFSEEVVESVLERMFGDAGQSA